MVTFTCEQCGDSIKKPKIKQHIVVCSSTFSCVDCSKTFYGDEVHAHTSCISEAEKYQGALYRGKKSPAPAAVNESNAEDTKSLKRAHDSISVDEHKEEDLSAVLRTVFSRHPGGISLKKMQKADLVEVQRVYSLRRLSEGKKSSITANMLTSLLDLPVSLTYTPK